MAAEVISLGEWLDHIPLPDFSCCGWGLVVGLAGKEGGKGDERMNKIKERGKSGKAHGERWQSRQFSLTQQQR